VRLGADVGGDRHLADVELIASHHATERGDERIDLDEIEREGARLDGAILERAVIALGAGGGFELELGHGRIVRRYSLVSSAWKHKTKNVSRAQRSTSEAK
jgi:hypothetical protein